MKRCILNLLLLLQLTLIFAQSDNTDQTGISVDQYKKLQSLDPRPDPSRRWMDTLMFPAKEAATGVLAATKNENRLPGRRCAFSIANSSSAGQ